MKTLIRLARYGFIASAVAVSWFASILFGGVSVAHAETHVSGYLSAATTTWTVAEGPYIVDDDVTVPPGATLVIMPGAKVVGANLIMYTPGIYAAGGNILIKGRGRSRVSLQHLGAIGAYAHGSLEIENADIDGVTSRNPGVTLSDSIALIATTTISNTKIAIDARRSALAVRGSRLYYDESGIVVRDPAPPVLVRETGSETPAPDTGGIGNALEEIYPVNISGSSFQTSGGYAIANYSSDVVHAAGNWWGGSSPNGGGSNSPFGPIELFPWLSTEPPLDLGPIDCCSSILFLPGIEGTRLFADEIGMSGSSTNQLWEPNRNLDVEKLFMNASGASRDPAVYAGDPIGKALGISDIYGSFMSFLDSLVRRGVIGEWRPFGYDWRKSPDEVALEPVLRATSTESLIDVVGALAGRSQTGKVTIVAHSNGGLVVKSLIKALQERGMSGSIDQLISVAVPYLGTPAAIGALLHGDGQSIFHGLILSQSTARSLARDLPSAYSLLPSDRFFAEVQSPVLSFSSSTIPGLVRNDYSKDVTSADESFAFVTDAHNDRSEPATSSTALPIRGNLALTAAARSLHSSIDAYVWPADISRWAILGWNAFTTKGIEYFQKTSCSFSASPLSVCSAKPAHHATTTLLGDGTVVAPSAAYDSGSIVSLDLAAESRSDGFDVSHANILNASTTQAAIEAIVRSEHSEALRSISSMRNASVGQPPYTKDSNFLVLSTHSPVELHVYDSAGRHTGPISKPASLADNDAISGAYEEGIPGSRFEAYDSDAGQDSYVYLPADFGQTYRASIEGTDFGEFIFDVDRFSGEKNISSVVYAPAPATPLSTAVASITSTSSSISLNLDIDGDGVSDISIATSTPAALADPTSYLSALKVVARSLAASSDKSVSSSGKELSKRIDRLLEQLKSAKSKRLGRHEQSLIKRLGYFKRGKVGAAGERRMCSVIDEIVSAYEKDVK